MQRAAKSSKISCSERITATWEKRQLLQPRFAFARPQCGRSCQYPIAASRGAFGAPRSADLNGRAGHVSHFHDCGLLSENPTRMTTGGDAEHSANYDDDPCAVAVAETARRLNELREAWLNPP